MRNQAAEAKELLEAMGLLRKGYAPTFQEFVTMLPKSLFDEAFKVDEDPGLAATAKLMYAVLICNNFSNPTFRIRPGLATLLVHTDLPDDMSVDFLKLPFEGIVVEIPAGTLSPPLEKSTRIYISDLSEDRFRVAVCEDETGSVHYASINKELGETVKEVCDNTRKLSEKMMPKELLDRITAKHVFSDYFHADFFTFAVNVALYLTSGGADVLEDRSEAREIADKLQGARAGVKRDTLLDQMKKVKEHKTFICGSNLKIQREMIANLTEEGRKVTKRFRVRGHWRFQPCGEGRLERKYIFISPHWKGPTYSELLERNYIVGERSANA